MTDIKTEPHEDLDLKIYGEKATEHARMDDLSQLAPSDQKVLLMSGIDPEQKERSGSFLQMDHSVVHCRATADGLELLSITEARQRYNGLKEYWFQAVSADKDIYTRRTEAHPPYERMKNSIC